MKIGYACLTVGIENANYKSCTLKNANKDNILKIIEFNLNTLDRVIEYNIENNIKLFRISSDIVPFASLPINKVKWWDIYSQKLLKIGRKIIDNNIRVSMHPGQYTVLNSYKEDVVLRAVADLKYHCQFLDSLGVNSQHKLILHIGGVYDNKEEAINRFMENYLKLDDNIKKRLVIENDDKSYNICEVLDIGKKLNIPVVYDNLHNAINYCDINKSDDYWIKECSSTWGKYDGDQKIHYSQQDQNKQTGSHSKTIIAKEFINFYNKINSTNLDIMLEVKDKNLSAVKCNNCLLKETDNIVNEWEKYKLLILEASPEIYQEISMLLLEKNIDKITFYSLIEQALEEEKNIENSIKALLHIWSIFKGISAKEEIQFKNNIEKYKQGKISIKLLKNNIKKIAVKYNCTNIIDCYYFKLN